MSTKADGRRKDRAKKKRAPVMHVDKPRITARQLARLKTRLHALPTMTIRQFFGRDLVCYDGPVLHMGQALGEFVDLLLQGRTLPVVVEQAESSSSCYRLVGAVSQLDLIRSMNRCRESRHRKCLGFFDCRAMVALQHTGTPIAQPVSVDDSMMALLEALKTPKTGLFVVDRKGHLYRLTLDVILRRLFEYAPLLIAARPVGRSFLAARKARHPVCKPSTPLLKLILGGVMTSKRRLILVESSGGKILGVITPGIVLSGIVAAQDQFLGKTSRETPRERSVKWAKRSPIHSLTVRDVLDRARPPHSILRLEWNQRLDDRVHGRRVWEELIAKEQAFVFKDGECIGYLHSAWLMADEVIELALRLFFT